MNLQIYGIHLLNPYKTVVSHLKLFFDHSGHTSQFFDCTWLHGGHVGGKNNSEKGILEI